MRMRDDEGSTLVEFAVILPVLMTIVIAIAQFGLAFNNYLVLTDAVRAATRQLALSRGQSGNCAAAVTRLENAAPNLTAASLTISITASGSPYTSSCSSATLTAGSDATISASYPCNLGVFGLNFAPSCSMTAQMTERIE